MAVRGRGGSQSWTGHRDFHRASGRIQSLGALPKNADHLHGISTLNVCSLRSCALEAGRFLSTEKPLLCVFTETKLLTWEHKHDFVANLHSDYVSFISSKRPEDTKNTMSSRTGLARTPGRAGVLIAVKKNFAQSPDHAHGRPTLT